MANSTVKKSHSICWTCLRSRPIPGIGCSWARMFKPVKGWGAEKTAYPSCNGRPDVISYRVYDCPLYVEEQHTQSTIVDEQMA